MQRFLLKHAWWMVSTVAASLLVSHTLDWKPIKVDTNSLILLAIILFSPFLATLKKIKIGDFEAEIDPQEVRRVRDQVEAQAPGVTKDKEIEQSPPEIRAAIDSIKELAKTDHVMALAKLRIEIEKVLRTLYSLALPGERELRALGLGNMIHKLTVGEILRHDITSPLREVISLCNRAIHGEEIRPHDAAMVADVGTSLLLRLSEELAHFAPRPKESMTITVEEAERFQSANYRVVTVVPYVEKPIRNVYHLNQEGLDQFLEGYGEFAECIVEITELH